MLLTRRDKETHTILASVLRSLTPYEMRYFNDRRTKAWRKNNQALLWEILQRQ